MANFDTGSTGFMLLATSLVMLMTPGLAFFYGGLAGKRNILGIMIQSCVSMGITTVLWVICGYSLCFSGDAMGGIIGNLDKAFLHGVDLNTPCRKALSRLPMMPPIASPLKHREYPQMTQRTVVIPIDTQLWIIMPSMFRLPARPP